ncbi:MAG TPA: hypothetical protein LFW21_02920 [Rickettsia endosymbiont of Pyrocoelia pectoralis]|nr:hypothetical protein [Rickettsia endosymbiont of Pyrocoelia pectoralis]
MKHIGSFEATIKNQNSSEKIRPLIGNDDLFQKIVEDGRFLSKETIEQISKETSEETLDKIKKISREERARTLINDIFLKTWWNTNT